MLERKRKKKTPTKYKEIRNEKESNATRK